MHRWIATAQDLEQLAPQLSGAPVLGIDTEFMRVRTYWPELALLQICVDGEVWLIDPLACGPLQPIAPVLARASPTKVIHGASEDIAALGPTSTGGWSALFDTQVAAAFAGLGPGVGYQRLVAELLGTNLEKTETRSDWLARPLTAQQLHYAEADVVHLAALHEQLVERLDRRGMVQWCVEDCARVARGSQAAAQPHWDFKPLWKWPHERQMRLRKLLEWREQAARRANLPRLWLFDNQAAVGLVESVPIDQKSLADRLAGHRAFPPREVAALWHTLTAPLDDADAAGFEPIPEPLKDELAQRFEALRTRVAARAAELDLPPTLIAPRRVIEHLARGRPSVDLLGWRSEVLAADLAALGLPLPAIQRV